MKEMVRYGFILALICAIASGLLAGVNSLTKSKIIAQAEAEEDAVLLELLPGAGHFEAIKSKEGEIIYYKAMDKGGNLIGVAFKASGKGYSSIIETMVGMAKDGEITAIKVINQNETPGLGVHISEKPFMEQFANKKTTDLASIQVITGATISSRAVIDSVTKKSEEIKRLIDNEK